MVPFGAPITSTQVLPAWNSSSKSYTSRSAVHVDESGVPSTQSVLFPVRRLFKVQQPAPPAPEAVVVVLAGAAVVYGPAVVVVVGPAVVVVAGAAVMYRCAVVV